MAQPVDWRQVNAVVITHAHLDHSGHLPVLGTTTVGPDCRTWGQHSSDALADRLRGQHGWVAVVPPEGERVLI